MNKFERLKELESQKLRYEEFFRDSKGYDYVCLSTHPHKQKSFFEQTKTTKRVSGIPQIIDLPDTLNLIKVIFDLVDEDYRRICKEFAELQKDL